MYNWCYTTGFVIVSLLVLFIFLILVTYFYDFKAFIQANITNEVEKSKFSFFKIKLMF